MKLIDADALKAALADKYDWALVEMIGVHIDAMPDAGCARHDSTTQFCAEVLDLQNQMRDVLDRLDAAREKYLLEVGYPQNKLEWADGVEEAVDEMRAVVGAK